MIDYLCDTVSHGNNKSMILLDRSTWALLKLKGSVHMTCLPTVHSNKNTVQWSQLVSVCIYILYCYLPPVHRIQAKEVRHSIKLTRGCYISGIQGTGPIWYTACIGRLQYTSHGSYQPWMFSIGTLGRDYCRYLLTVTDGPQSRSSVFILHTVYIK